jgi:hypothetical protein
VAERTMVSTSWRLRSAGLVGTQDGVGERSNIVLRKLVPPVPSGAANLSEHGLALVARAETRGRSGRDWARICPVKQAVKVPASATESVLCYSFLACCLSTIVTDATMSAENQLCVHHGPDLTLELTRYRRHAVPALPTSFPPHPPPLPPTPRHFSTPAFTRPYARRSLYRSLITDTRGAAQAVTARAPDARTYVNGSAGC